MTKYTPEAIEQLKQNLITLVGSEEKLKAEMRKRMGPPWPKEYVNRDTGKTYAPHTQEEHDFVFSDTPSAGAILGGEGGGKTVALTVKILERCRRGMSGVLAGPDLPHTKKSAWPEFRRWCPWDQVIPKHRDRGHFAWEPYSTFDIAFNNGAILKIGGLDDPKRWRGPNISFAALDEIAVKRDAQAVKVLSGRVRITGPNGEPPQLFCATTPEMHWLHDYFGPLKCLCNNCHNDVGIDIQKGAEMKCPLCDSTNLSVEDDLEHFKRNSTVILLPTVGNIENLDKGYIAARRSTLTEAEARVFMEAAWENVASGQPFLPSMMWWDDCKDDISPLDKKTPIILAADAATGRDSGDSDCFGLLAVSRHPKRKDTVIVRYVKTWQVKAGQKLDFRGTKHNPGPEREILRFCGWELNDDNEMRKIGGGYNVKCVVADPRDLHDMITRLERKRVVWMRRFGQLAERTQSDSDLLRLIQEKRIIHDGNETLRRHIANADRKLDPESKKLRICKRLDRLKIDLAICLSMASFEALRLNI